MDTVYFLAAPITASLLLAAILSYFGNHILTRGIIFIDIAVAQVAALGTMLGILIGVQDGTLLSTVISLAFTLVILSLFSLAKFQHTELSREVIIGVIYCVALATAMLLVDAVQGGANFVQKTLTGSLLWVSWNDIVQMLLLFSLVICIHAFFRKQFIALSENSEQTTFSSYNRRLDLLFYVTFGFVIVQAVKIGGIFLVFMYLIAPATLAQLYTDSWNKRFVISFVTAMIGSLAGIYISYQYNFPNGPTIVCALGALLIMSILAQQKRLV
ncbi:hypothetical protein GF407_17415 [candidate division KSB1 bacterium]|nr:hypothetical protein [candidate division KSB1 bacterium]